MGFFRYLIGYAVIRKFMSGDALFAGIFLACIFAGVIFVVLFVIIGLVILSL